MTAIIIGVCTLALLVTLVERNDRRHTGPRPPLAGSNDVADADLRRVRAELALCEPEPGQQSSGHAPFIATLIRIGKRLTKVVRRPTA